MHLRRKERYKHQTRKDSPSKGWKYSRGCEDSISLQEYVLSQKLVLQERRGLAAGNEAGVQQRGKDER